MIPGTVSLLSDTNGWKLSISNEVLATPWKKKEKSHFLYFMEEPNPYTIWGVLG